MLDCDVDGGLVELLDARHLRHGLLEPHQRVQRLAVEGLVHAEQVVVLLHQADAQPLRVDRRLEVHVVLNAQAQLVSCVLDSQGSYAALRQFCSNFVYRKAFGLFKRVRFFSHGMFFFLLDHFFFF